MPSRCSITYGLDGAIVVVTPWAGRVAQLLALDHPGKVKKLILASSGAAHPGDRGIPLRIAKEWSSGLCKYVRITPSWSAGPRSNARNHMNEIEEVSAGAHGESMPGGVLLSAMCWRART